MCKQSIHTLILAIFLSISPTIVFSASDISGEIINVNRKYKIAFTDLSNQYLKSGDIVEVRNRGEFVTYLEVSESSGAISKLVAVRVKGKYETKISFKRIKVGNSLRKIAGADEIILEVQGTQKKNVGMRDNGIKEKVGKERLSSKLLTESLAVEKRERREEMKKLSENYVILSNNLAELMGEKKSLEAKYSQFEIKIEKERKKLQKVEIKNSMLEEENRELKVFLKKMQESGSDKKIRELKKTISILKKKLERMARIMDSERNKI